MNVSVSVSETLRGALTDLLDGLPPKQAGQAVERLIANYRGATPTDAPILRDRADVVAYAAYRMPHDLRGGAVGAGGVRGRRTGLVMRPVMWTWAAAPARRPGR